MNRMDRQDRLDPEETREDVVVSVPQVTQVLEDLPVNLDVLFLLRKFILIL